MLYQFICETGKCKYNNFKYTVTDSHIILCITPYIMLKYDLKQNSNFRLR